VLRDHGTAQRLLERLDEIVFRHGGDIEPAILVGEAFGAEDAFLTGPGKSLGPIADDVNG
jgi:hypothetical protein